MTVAIPEDELNELSIRTLVQMFHTQLSIATELQKIREILERAEQRDVARNAITDPPTDPEMGRRYGRVSRLPGLREAR